MPPMAPTVPPSPIFIPTPPFPADQACVSPQFARRVPLTPGPRAAAKARAEVAAAIRAWDIPVDPDVALLLTSELVTNAVTHGGVPPVVLVITAGATGLRIDVHDGSLDLPVLELAATEDESGRGLLLVTSLSAEWGFYRTQAGKAVYFVLTVLSGPNETVTNAQEPAGSRSVS
jgi:anti-sigma regulatory factor (Ser/Thr protein kinase)